MYNHYCLVPKLDRSFPFLKRSLPNYPAQFFTKFDSLYPISIHSSQIFHSQMFVGFLHTSEGTMLNVKVISSFDTQYRECD